MLELNWTDWQCPTCHATRECIGRTGSRPLPHLRRIVLTAVLRAAQRCSLRLPRPQRLLAATAILSDTPDSADETDEEPFWATLAITFEQAGLLLQRTATYVRDDSRVLTDTRELAEQVEQAGEALEDAGSVLREMRDADLPRDDEMVNLTRP